MYNTSLIQIFKTAAKQKAGYLTELLNVNVVTCKIQMQMIKIISLDLL